MDLNNLPTDFKILQVGNFYFPVGDYGQKFKVEDMHTFEIEDKEVIRRFLTLRKFENNKTKTFQTIYLREYSELIWNECKKHLYKYLNRGYYFCPMMITYHKYKKYECISVHVDLLKKVTIWDRIKSWRKK
jgi:hypothetical protein